MTLKFSGQVAANTVALQNFLGDAGIESATAPNVTPVDYPLPRDYTFTRMAVYLTTPIATPGESIVVSLITDQDTTTPLLQVVYANPGTVQGFLLATGIVPILQGHTIDIMVQGSAGIQNPSFLSVLLQ